MLFTSNRLIKFLFFLYIAASLSGCALRTRIMVDLTSPVVDAMNIAFNKNCDIELMRESMPFGLYSISGLIDISPKNRQFLTNAAQGYFGYSFAFVEDENNERAKKLYLLARDYGLRAVFQDNYSDLLNAPVKNFDDRIKHLRKKDIPPLFWTTLAWLSYVKLNLSDVKVFLELPKAEAFAHKLMELDQTYYFGSPHVIMGCYYSAQPEISGGNPEKSKEHFEKAIELSDGKFLMHHLYYAKFYAVRIQDRDLFLELINHILEAPDDILPSHCALTGICKAKAKLMLDTVDDYF